MTQQPISRALAQELSLRCVGAQGLYEDVVAAFVYDASDPYAVRVTIPTGVGDSCWTLCRTLLSRGLTDPAGEGDVQLWPSTDDAGSGVVVLDLWSHEAHVVAEVATRDLYRFLTRTLAAVPFGREHEHLDLDRLIADLLTDAGSGTE